MRIPLSQGFQIILLAKTTYLHLHPFLYFGPENPKCKLGEHQLHSEHQEQRRDEAPEEEVHHRDREEGTKQLLDVGKKCEAAAARVVEKVEKTPMRSHEGWGRALKMSPTEY